jgi:hypothetical protein
MARVYRVYDELAGRDIALKQWHSGPEHRARTQSIAQFEYEYITLAQLSHPCMIEVYDYGLSNEGPYFTMELLDGGDLREHAPLPWVRACQIFHEVCSSLALLHSRRLIHRDISPRNIRCTRRGGAKLIDFGAMLPMGLCQQVVGTPAFAAPEVVQGLPLDARVDLFSLGATLYFALTGKQPSSARDFADVTVAAQRKPLPPSRIVPDIPKALDGLVLSMLDPNPALRPRSAFEVMQRLAALAHLHESEPTNVAKAYLATPELVGRDAILTRLRQRCGEASGGQGGTVIIEGQAGMGRSRVLDVCALWAKTLGAIVLKTRGSSAHSSERPLSRQLAEQLIAALPFAGIRKLRNAISDFDALFEDDPIDASEHTAVLEQSQRKCRLRRGDARNGKRRQEQVAVARAIQLASQDHPMVVAIDDATNSDAEGLSMLAELSFDAAAHRLLLVVTWAAREGDERPYNLQRERAENHIRERAECLLLEHLSLTQSTQLLSSVFGDVPNIALLGDRIHAVSAGNPGTTLEIAQWLVARNLVKYEAGNWALPNSLHAAELPTCAAEALRARKATLSPLARELAVTQALALHDGFGRATYHALSPHRADRQIDAAITELLRQRVIELEHDTYTLAQRTWVPVLLEGCDEAVIQRSHEALARYHQHTPYGTLHLVHHLLCAGENAAALDQMLAVLRAQGDDLSFELFSKYQISPSQIAFLLARCLSAVGSLQRPSSEEHLVRRWLTILSVLTQDEYFFLASPAWREQLKRDAGLVVDAPVVDTSTRVYTPVEALRNLAGYVSCALAIAARRMDPQLMASLPGLLKPFAGLAPEIRMIWQVATAAELVVCRCQVEQARARLYAVFEELNALPDQALQHRPFIRNALAYAIGASEISLGIQTGERWADELDADPLQAVNAMYLRKLLRLQRGDVEGAERFRRKAELLAMHANASQMFTSTVMMELIVHGVSGDLLGIKQLSAQIGSLAERNPCWAPYAALATGYFERLRGNPTTALEAFEQCLKRAEPSADGHFTFAWLFAEAGRAETLVDMDEAALAAALARKALSRCRKCGVIALGQVLVRALALAEAKLGQFASAAELLDTSIEAAQLRGVSVLQLGSLYEARTYVAIEARDTAAIERFARLTAHEYGYAQGSSLGARCERLLEAAAAAAAHQDTQSPSSWGATLQSPSTSKSDRTSQLNSEVARAMDGAEAAEGRALRALRLLCEAHEAAAGHLYFADDHGVRLAASFAAVAPGAALAHMTAHHLQNDLQQRADVTRVDSNTQPRLEPDARMQWKDGGDTAFEPLVLHCNVAGEARCAGVAWLARQQAPIRNRRPAQFTGALARHLIEQRETTGI